MKAITMFRCNLCDTKNQIETLMYQNWNQRGMRDLPYSNARVPFSFHDELASDQVWSFGNRRKTA